MAIALALFTTIPSAHAATAAGAGIELNGEYVGGYTITWDGESRDDLVRQLSKHYITFERDFEIPVDAKDPTLATLKGKVRLLSKIRGDRQVMATTTVLQLVKRGEKWYAEPESLKLALKDIVLNEELDRARWPAGTVMAADKSNATHRMTLTFSIDGHTGDQKHVYLFRVLDKPSNLVINFRASGSHADGKGGGYGLYVMPKPLSVFKDNRVSFKISFEGKRNDKETSVEESIDVPLLKEASGQVGLIKYKTKWKAYKRGAHQLGILAIQIADEASADDSKPSPPNSVYAKIIVPSEDAAEGEHPAVESWISEKLRKQGETELTSVTDWFRLAEEGEKHEWIWTATVKRGPDRKCPAIGRVRERTADGEVRVMVCWLSPDAPKIQGDVLPAEIGSRGIAVVEAGSGFPNKAYVALLVGPPLGAATQD